MDDLKSYQNMDDLKSYQNMDDLKSYQNMDDLKSYQNMDDLKSYQNMDDLKSYQNMDDLKSYQNMDDLKSYQNMDDLKSYQNMDDLKSYQNMDDLKSYQNIEGLRKTFDISEEKSLQYEYTNKEKLAKSSGEVLDVQKDGEWICRGDLCNQQLGQDSPTTPSSKPIDASQVKCPFGYQRGFIDGKIICQQLRKSVLKKLLRKKKCPKGQKAALTSYGIDCVGPDGKKVCPKGQRLIEKVDGQYCELVTTVAPACGTGYEPVKTSDGIKCKKLITTTPMMMTCLDGQILIETKDGQACVDVTIATTPTTPAPTTVLPTTTTTVATTTTTAAPTTTSTTTEPTTTTTTTAATTTTEVICPAGLRRILTPVGFVCRYVGRPPTTTTALPTCPPGKTLTKTRDGHVCVSEPPTREPDTRCPSGQMLVKESRGLRCKRMHGDIPKEYLCPPGLIPVKTDSGTKCRYHKKTTSVKNIVHRGCPSGQVLTVSQVGFLCKKVVDDSHPVCPRGQVVVQIHGVLQCIRESQSKLKCGSGQVLTRTQNGFFCRHKKFNFRRHCSDGEVLVVEKSVRECVKLDKGTNLCGPRYKAVMTGDGLVCKLFHLEFGCPVGYYLSQTGDSPECLPLNPHRENCDPDLSVPCPTSDPIMPCDKGYTLVSVGSTHVCELKEYVSVVCHDSPSSSAARCFIKSVRQCKSTAIQDGCHPQCANGGTCMDGVCSCPPGVTGKACQSDINECEWLVSTYCQFDCRNTFGSFECTCPHRSTLNSDGRTCKVIQCIPECMNGGECHDGTCLCPPGFTGSVCQDDVDECSVSNMCEHYCRNTYGSFACLCPPGSRLAADHRSCQNTTCQPSCRYGGRCLNRRCICPRQFTGIICQLDVNECYQGNHECSHSCQNVIGSYRCSCPSRMVLGTDKKTCHAFRRNL
ncbi:neurogenic locus Notch protein-like [Gigantopelta aegis]|uniref:neurogenic locus Notch protein-like n=1 Tax=Gigantopelta aegis TaxID=1735272 RepID=UPI001B88DE3E|nr:neurogenic locus Notch protein-like [Gigantopelta aegis]